MRRSVTVRCYLNIDLDQLGTGRLFGYKAEFGCGENMFRLAFIFFFVFSVLPAQAATAYFFSGTCRDSRVKIGKLEDDLAKEPGDPIHCDVAVLLELKNGRKLMQFVTGIGALGFSGATLDQNTNPNMVILPVDRLYPVRDLGTTAEEQLKRSSQAEGAIDDVEGYCFFQPKKLARVTSLSCVTKYEKRGIKTVHSIKMDVRKVTRKTNFPDP